MLKPITDVGHLKLKFFAKFWALQKENPKFNIFLTSIRNSHDGYVLGGFLRDIINGNKSRDIDLVFNITQEQLIDALTNSGLEFRINRMSGIKVILNNFEADIWTIKNNWAFKSKVIKIKDDRILDNIADGCFYNYDSLVMNINNGNARVKHYNDCVILKKLDILKKRPVYKERNPTVEANILRALFLNKVYNIDYSDNCISYLAKKLMKLNSDIELAAKKINLVKQKYPKYTAALSEQVTLEMLISLLKRFDELNKAGTNFSQTALDLNLKK